MEKPTKPCLCGTNDWWQRPDGGWGCSRCHPNPHPGSNLDTKEKYTPEILSLRDRVILGNKKLNDAWEQIRAMVHDTEEWSEQMKCWNQANEKLSLLCTELKALGYNDCLYLDGQGRKTRKCLEGMGCRVCPSKIRYSEKELMELPSPGAKDAQADHGG